MNEFQIVVGQPGLLSYGRRGYLIYAGRLEHPSSKWQDDSLSYSCKEITQSNLGPQGEVTRNEVRSLERVRR